MVLYGPIHKCLRNVLSNVSLHCGNANYDDAGSFEKVQSALSDAITILRHHAQNEEEFIHPLYRTVDLPFEELEGKHKELEDQVDELERVVEKIKASPVGSPERAQAGAELYRRVNLFVSDYFAHLDEEEYRFLPALMERMPHEQVVATRSRLHEAIRCDDLLFYLKYQIATLNPIERFRVMMEYRRVQPAAFGEMCRIAEAALPQSEWASLKAQLPAA